MSLILPFAGLRVSSEYASRVLSPPYDVLNRAEAKEYAKNNPYSFLHVTKPEIDLPEGENAYSAAVYEKGKENLTAMISQHILEQDSVPHYYLYQIQSGEHKQTGLVALCAMSAYADGRIKKHELTRETKLNDRRDHMLAIEAQSGPVMLAYRDTPALKALRQSWCQEKALIEVDMPNGTTHRLWKISDENEIEATNKAFASLSNLYIADGHHRSEAAYQAKHSAFLGVCFPDTEMQILSYHRVVSELNGLTSDEFISQLEEHFIIGKSQEPVLPQQARELGLYLKDHGWLKLQLKAPIKSNLIQKQLEVQILSDFILEPLLGIVDILQDPRIDFVGGSRGLSELEKRVDSGEMQAAFALYPTSLDDLFAIADQNEVMPPKSTWFEPKLADGLITAVFSQA